MMFTEQERHIKLQIYEAIHRNNPLLVFEAKKVDARGTNNLSINNVGHGVMSRNGTQLTIQTMSVFLSVSYLIVS